MKLQRTAHLQRRGPRCDFPGLTKDQASVHSRHVLDVHRQTYPGMHAFFVNRKCWRRKAGLCEGADWDSDTFLSDFIVHCCTADRAEVESDLAAFIADAYILLRLALDLCALLAKARLNTKHAAGSALTCETVTHRYPNRIFGGRCRELPTTTGSGSYGHGGRG